MVDAIKNSPPEELRAAIRNTLGLSLRLKDKEFSQGLISDLRFPPGEVINAIEELEFRYDFPIFADDLENFCDHLTEPVIAIESHRHHTNVVILS